VRSLFAKADKLDPGRFDDMAFGGIILTGCFVTALMLLYTAIFMPGLFEPRIMPTVLWFWGSALTAGLLDILVCRLGFGLWLHIVVFTITQWTGWWARIWAATGHQPPFFFNPRLGLKHWEWMVAVIVLWVMAVFCSRILNRLSRIPKIYIKPGNPRGEDLAFKPNLEPWEKDWRMWRGLVIFLMLMGVLGFVVGVSVMRVREENVLGMLLLQVIFGFGLTATGSFYYRRAFWKTDGLVPEARLGQIWRRASLLLVIGPAIFGFVLPGNFQKLDQWWLLNQLNRLFVKTTPEDLQRLSNLVDRLRNTRQGVKHMEPSLLMTILGYLLAIPVLILLVAGILAILGLIVVYLLDRLKLIPKEVGKLKGIGGFFIHLYLRWLKFWRRHRAQRIVWLRKRHSEKDVASQGSRNSKRHRSLWWGKGPKALIRRGYYRFIGHARAKGFRLKTTQTPQEIAKELAVRLPGDENELAEITASYHEARYGPEEPAQEKVRIFEELRRRLQGRMR
jgi:hypothetical protein